MNRGYSPSTHRFERRALTGEDRTLDEAEPSGRRLGPGPVDPARGPSERVAQRRQHPGREMCLYCAPRPRIRGPGVLAVLDGRRGLGTEARCERVEEQASPLLRGQPPNLPARRPDAECGAHAPLL